MAPWMVHGLAWVQSLPEPLGAAYHSAAMAPLPAVINSSAASCRARRVARLENKKCLLEPQFNMMNIPWPIRDRHASGGGLTLDEVKIGRNGYGRRALRGPARDAGRCRRTQACQAQQCPTDREGRSLLRGPDWVPDQTGSMKTPCLLMPNHSPVIRPHILDQNAARVNLARVLPGRPGRKPAANKHLFAVSVFHFRSLFARRKKRLTGER